MRTRCSRYEVSNNGTTETAQGQREPPDAEGAGLHFKAWLPPACRRTVSQRSLERGMSASRGMRPSTSGSDRRRATASRCSSDVLYRGASWRDSQSVDLGDGGGPARSLPFDDCIAAATEFVTPRVEPRVERCLLEGALPSHEIMPCVALDPLSCGRGSGSRPVRQRQSPLSRDFPRARRDPCSSEVCQEASRGVALRRAYRRCV
jgi:hypothetical protein